MNTRSRNVVGISDCSCFSHVAHLGGSCLLTGAPWIIRWPLLPEEPPRNIHYPSAVLSTKVGNVTRV